ncbi:MAG: SLC13/DASS family transporter [Deltaproteobacteria bacterium]|nr:SLC13/DASS family transporter [Deltaproteobacteria bacterium]MBW2498760.1 SLC13/DASS family transporter [Deltaproteobacteria bacterium]
MSDERPEATANDDGPNRPRPRVGGRRLGLIALALAAGGAVQIFLPLGEVASGADPERIRLGLAILALTGTLWLTEALPLASTALLVPILAALGGILDVRAAFASFAHPLIFLFLGGFGLAAALSRHGLDAWLANRVLRLAGGGFLASSLALFTISAGLSMWISNTATAALLLPVALGILGQVERRADRATADRATPHLLLGVAYAASIGGIGTLVGSPPNAIAAAALDVGFTDWLALAMPFVAVLLPGLFVLLPLLTRPGLVPRVEIDRSDFRFDAGRLGALGIFALTVLCWLFSRPLADALGVGGGFDSLIAMGALVALGACGLVDWQDIERKTNWGVLILFGGGLSLSRVLQSTGASLHLAEGLADLVAGLPMLGVLTIVVLFVVFLTEVSSNTATAALFVPIFLELATRLERAPAALVVPVAVACSCAFMLPIATPPNAIVFGSGRIAQRHMIRVGLVLNLAFTAAIAGLASLLL